MGHTVGLCCPSGSLFRSRGIASVNALAEKLGVDVAVLLQLAEAGRVYNERDIREYMRKQREKATAHLRSLRYNAGVGAKRS